MPCHDTWAEEDSRRRDLQELNNRIDELSQNLCFLCGQAEYNGVFEDLAFNNDRLRKWWKNHQASDTRRVQKEMRQRKEMNPQKLADSFIKKAKKVHPVSKFHMEWFLDLAEAEVERKKKEQEAKDREEALRQQALSRLSAEEKRVLGVK